MNGNKSNDAMFSRGETTGELRGDSPKWALAVLDAVSLSRDQSRISLVNEIICEWAKSKLHEATLIHRVTQGYPELAELCGKEPE